MRRWIELEVALLILALFTIGCESVPATPTNACPVPPGMSLEFLDAAEAARSAAIDKFVFDYETFLLKMEFRNVAR
jgi:hypothetical protein